MEVINKPRVYYTRKSLNFLVQDKRKLVSAIAVFMLPFVNNLWRLVPEDIQFPFYETADIFVWNFCAHFLFVIIAVAWFFTIPKKDQALKFITLSSMAYGIYLTILTLPFTDETPVWLDITSTFIVLGFLYLCINYIKDKYLSKPSDYKVLHDGLVYDIHHQRFLGSINRIAGLLEIADMEEPYKHLCEQEIADIKESIAYIAEKYEELK